MVRVDMSEYMEKHAVSRLIGSPPGYVGYEEGGQLTEAVRRRPYSVLLLDEIEKAHPETFHLLLQLLDEGRLTDGHGRTVDFRNTVVIMTSNVGTAELSHTEIGFTGGGVEEADRSGQLLRELHRVFRPEFLNRVDEIIAFRALTREQIGEIVEMQVRALQKRLEAQKITLRLTEAARSFLAERGYDPAYGARAPEAGDADPRHEPAEHEAAGGRVRGGRDRGSRPRRGSGDARLLRRRGGAGLSASGGRGFSPAGGGDETQAQNFAMVLTYIPAHKEKDRCRR